MNSALSPTQRLSIFVFFLLRASPRPTPPGLEAPGKVSRVPGPGHCSSRLCPKPPAVPSAAYGQPPTPCIHTFMSHRGCVVLCCWPHSVSSSICESWGPLCWVPTGRGGPESGALLAFSRAQACGPQLLLSYCASSSHTPNPRGRWCVRACMCESGF